jgi:hypothetical protein
MATEPPSESKAGSLPAPQYTLSGKDYLELWKYFESRAETFKAEMFKVISWLIGFMAGVLGYVGSTLLKIENGKLSIQHGGFLLFWGVVGTFLSLYAARVFVEYKEHIERNWYRSNVCINQIKGLDAVVAKPNEPKKSKDEGAKLPSIWTTLGLIIGAFALVFASLIIFPVLG